jgi:hypothetical protein
LNYPRFVSHAIAPVANPVDPFFSQLQITDHEYIVAGDEAVFGKAGKETYGIGRFRPKPQ